MSDVELSPMGATRERGCPCRRCRTETFNFSAVCSRCRAEKAREQRDRDRLDEHEQRDGEEVA